MESASTRQDVTNSERVGSQRRRTAFDSTYAEYEFSPGPAVLQLRRSGEARMAARQDVTSSERVGFLRRRTAYDAAPPVVFSAAAAAEAGDTRPPGYVQLPTSAKAPAKSRMPRVVLMKQADQLVFKINARIGNDGRVVPGTSPAEISKLCKSIKTTLAAVRKMDRMDRDPKVQAAAKRLGAVKAKCTLMLWN